MNRNGIFRVDNATVLITIGAFLLLLGCLPLALRLDDSIDRDRPMYTDMASMAVLQDTNLAATGRVVPVDLSGGESARIGEAEFVASEGVSIAVRGLDDDTAYCITASNQYGVQAQEQCS